ncbi:hypothetical protein LGN28_25555, partial [Burkholderia cepacia]|nr:hypothetical protein [Burkholderia cepacia]
MEQADRREDREGNVPCDRDLVETLDFEEVYQRKLEHFKRIYPDWTAALESDPVVKLIELA